VGPSVRDGCRRRSEVERGRGRRQTVSAPGSAGVVVSADARLSFRGGRRGRDGATSRRFFEGTGQLMGYHHGSGLRAVSRRARRCCPRRCLLGQQRRQLPQQAAGQPGLNWIRASPAGVSGSGVACLNADPSSQGRTLAGSNGQRVQRPNRAAGVSQPRYSRPAVTARPPRRPLARPGARKSLTGGSMAGARWCSRGWPLPGGWPCRQSTPAYPGGADLGVQCPFPCTVKVSTAQPAAGERPWRRPARRGLPRRCAGGPGRWNRW